MKMLAEKMNLRLLAMLCLNGLLFYFENKYLTRWRSEERSANLHLIAAMIATVPLILALTVLFRGTLWQRLAGVVLSILPVAVLWSTIGFFQK